MLRFFRTSGNFICPRPLLLPLLLPLVPHQVKEEKRVLVRVRQVADCCLGDRAVHLHLTKQVGLELICLDNAH